MPLLDELHKWMEKTLRALSPKSETAGAIRYALSRWRALTRYADDGRLEIDNNGVENAIRPFIVGRKGWLFSIAVRGAKSSANLYSQIETAKANGLEPFAYLRHLFTELPTAKTVDNYEKLLPWNVDRAALSMD